MMVPAVFAVVSAWGLGTLVVATVWPRARAWSADVALILSLGLGTGLGITSVTFFAASLLAEDPLPLGLGLDLGLAALLGAAAWRRRRGRVRESVSPAGSFWLPALLGSVFGQAAIVALVATIRAYHAQPYSNADGWMIWLMRARFMFRGGADWPEALRAPQVSWTHPDYPLLVPASIARAWAFVGSDAPWVSGLISALFGIATVGLLVAAVARLRTRTVAFAGGLLLLGTPFFVTFSSNQHADIPLGFYILAALVLLVLDVGEKRGHGLALLAGATAGLAAWTKNEGQLFVVVAGLVWGSREIAHRSWRNLAAFAAGLTLALLPLAFFKLQLAPHNDIVASAPWSRWRELFDGSRHGLILATLARDIPRFGAWVVTPFLVMLLPLIGAGWKRIAPREWLVPAVVGLMLAGYYAVYLLTHWDLSAHLDSSLVRLLLQLWPAAILSWCLVVGSGFAPSDSVPRPLASPVRRRLIAALLVANLGVAAGVIAAMNRQLAGNELAAARIDGGRVRVLLDEGWFGRETHEGQTWAWAKGPATLRLQFDGSRATTVRLRFTLRSLGARTVTARRDNQEIWRETFGDEAREVAITALVLEPGSNAIVFHTDEPGVPEAPDQYARALTFAVYDPTIE